MSTELRDIIFDSLVDKMKSMPIELDRDGTVATYKMEAHEWHLGFDEEYPLIFDISVSALLDIEASDRDYPGTIAVKRITTLVENLRMHDDDGEEIRLTDRQYKKLIAAIEAKVFIENIV